MPQGMNVPGAPSIGKAGQGLSLPGVVAGPALVQDAIAVGSSGGNNQTATWTHVIDPAANLLVVALVCNVNANSSNSADITPDNAVTVGGVAMTKLATNTSSGSIGHYDRSCEFWYLVNPPTGSQTLQNTSQLDGATSFSSVATASISFKNAIVANPFGSVASNSTSSSSGATSLSTSTTTTSGVVLCVGVGRSTANLTAGAGQTVLETQLSGTNVELILTTQPASASATQTVSITTAADQMAMMALPVLSN